MEGYAFVTKEPLLGPVVLALRVDVPGRKEQLWMGEEQDVEAALRGKERPMFLAQTRPLGAFWCEFGQTAAEGWTEAIWALSDALTAKKRSQREEREQTASHLLSQQAEGSGTNAAAWYAAIQIWEMYLRCRKASRKAAKRQFDGRAKGKDYEQAYDREYMFWYNRITKLKKAGAPPEQIGRAQAALKEFRKEALIRKQQVKAKKLPATQFISWMIGQEAVIEEICQE